MNTRITMEHSQTLSITSSCTLFLTAKTPIQVTISAIENMGDECYIVCQTAQPHTVAFEDFARDDTGGFLKSITFNGAIADSIALKKLSYLRVVDMKGVVQKTYATVEEIRSKLKGK